VAVSPSDETERVANEESPSDHIPPAVVSISVIAGPSAQTVFASPVMGAGRLFTVTTLFVEQPVESVQVIVEVPGESPVTSPVTSIKATTVLLLLHMPPVGGVSVKIIEEPWHTVLSPTIGAGNGFITMAVETLQLPADNV
jgi:hypothetical protein